MKPQATHTTKPPARSLGDIQADFAAVMRQLHNLIEERTHDMEDEHQAESKARHEFETARATLQLAIAEHDLTQAIGEKNARIEQLKEEARQAYVSSHGFHGSTFRDVDGAGFQFRTSTKTVVSDAPLLAETILNEGLWDEIGAELTVNAAKASKVLKDTTLPGLGIETQVTVAAYGPKEN